MMLASLGILAYAASMMTHEALGHGGYCVAFGGHNAMLSAWGERCDLLRFYPAGIKVAGPGMQFAAGLVAWLTLGKVPSDAARLRFFLWLYMALDLLISSGYVAFSGLTGIGDAAEFIAGLHPQAVWQMGLVVLGSVLYFLCMRVTASELMRFAGSANGSSRLFRLALIPYLTMGVFACLTGALNRTMGHGAALGLAAASSFGGSSGMLRIPETDSRTTGEELLRTVYLRPSVGWSAAAAVVVVLFIALLGPGLEWAR